MKYGKVNDSVLRRSVLKIVLGNRIHEVNGPGLGNDAGVLTKTDTDIAVATGGISIEGKFLKQARMGQFTFEQAAKFAIIPVLNNLYAFGAKPKDVAINLLLTDRMNEAFLKNILKAIKVECDKHGVRIATGHTEINPHVNAMIINVTAHGQIDTNNNKLSIKNVQPNHAIIMTKKVGMSQAIKLATMEYETLSKRLSDSYISKVQTFAKDLCIKKEAIIAKDNNAIYMHDVSSDGILRALWELAEGANCGLRVDLKKIAIDQETVEFCELLQLNPYDIDSSGCLLIISKEPEELINIFNESDIKADIIGYMTKEKAKLVINQGEENHIQKAR